MDFSLIFYLQSIKKQKNPYAFFKSSVGIFLRSFKIRQQGQTPDTSLMGFDLGCGVIALPHTRPSACTFHASHSLRNGGKLMRWLSTAKSLASISRSSVR